GIADPARARGHQPSAVGRHPRPTPERDAHARAGDRLDHEVEPRPRSWTVRSAPAEHARGHVAWGPSVSSRSNDAEPKHFERSDDETGHDRHRGAGDGAAPDPTNRLPGRPCGRCEGRPAVADRLLEVGYYAR